MTPPNPYDEDVRAFLDQWRAPSPDPQGKQRVIELFSAPVPARRQSLRWAWLIARSQVRLVHPATWIASVLVIALGIGVTIALYQPTLSGTDLPFVLIAPLVAAVGVAFLYGLDSDPPLELQLSTPVTPRVILLARLTLLFGFNLFLGVAGSLALTFVHAEISLLPLILAWLAPMTFLSALAFLTSVILFGPLLSVFISLFIWVSQVVRRAPIDLLSLERIPDLFRLDQSPLLFGAAVAAVALALWLAEWEQRWTGSHS